MKKVIIVESPAKVKTISKYLGEEYQILASVGHIRDIPKSEKEAIDIENNFAITYVNTPGKQKVIRELKKETKDADLVLLATDPDREGEAIAWHITEILGKKNYKRISFNEITKDAVLRAIKNPREVDLNLKEAQEARRILDRLFGYTLSKLIWKKVRYGLSAGRVQSPALRIIAEKEREIEKFIPKAYFEMAGTFKKLTEEEFIFNAKDIFENKEEVENILKWAKYQKWVVKDVKTKITNKSPKAPFTTSTLQQQANNMFGWSATNTMRVAQKLYETGCITYIRTDSSTLSGMANKQIKDHVEEFYGKDEYEQNAYRSRGKNSQEAHEAIRPTSFKRIIAGKTPKEKNLYKTIYVRAVSSQMKKAKLESKSVIIHSENMPEFILKGIKVLDEGWFKADKASRSNEIELKEFNIDEILTCIDIVKKEKETQPPNRYSEAGLINILEKNGIGRPSTYASIIRTLIDRNYLEKINNSLKATTLGMVISGFLEKHFNHYISDTFTSTMEEDLDEIASGNKQYINLIKDFYYPFLKAVESKENIDKLTTIGKVDETIKCPICDACMVFKLAKNGKFMSCEKFPDCIGSRTESGEIIKEPESIGKECPKCGKGDLVRKTGKFGDFITCSKYPKCKYIEDDEEERKKKDTMVKCTECKTGSLLERSGRFGIFYSCSEYPNCNLAIKAKPTGEKCKECGRLMMDGTKTIPTRCSDKKCPMHNPHKL